MDAAVRRRDVRRPGRVTPPWARGLRARTVRLPRKGRMDWHSTRGREELLVVLSGRVRLEVDTAGRRRRLVLASGTSAFLSRATDHCVVNTALGASLYLYVTGPAGRAS